MLPTRRTHGRRRDRAQAGPPGQSWVWGEPPALGRRRQRCPSRAQRGAMALHLPELPAWGKGGGFGGAEGGGEASAGRRDSAFTPAGWRGAATGPGPSPEPRPRRARVPQPLSIACPRSERRPAGELHGLRPVLRGQRLHHLPPPALPAHLEGRHPPVRDVRPHLPPRLLRRAGSGGQQMHKYVPRLPGSRVPPPAPPSAPTSPRRPAGPSMAGRARAAFPAAFRAAWSQWQPPELGAAGPWGFLPFSPPQSCSPDPAGSPRVPSGYWGCWLRAHHAPAPGASRLTSPPSRQSAGRPAARAASAETSA